MMEKTIEEKRESVLAECERLFEDAVPGQCVEVLPTIAIQAGYLTDLFDNSNTDHECIYLNCRGRSIAELRSKSNEWEIDLFYRLLGLDARELETKISKANYLIDQLRARIADQHFDLKAERTNSAKLVEALESANDQYSNLCHDVARAALRDHESKDLWQMVEDYKLESYHESAREVMKLTIMHNEDKALEAHKKGGNND